MEGKKPIYTLVVKKQRIAVTEEVYRTYYKLTEREKYVDKLAKQKHLSFEACKEDGIQLDYIIQPQESIEDRLIKKEMLKSLSAAMQMLTEQERQLIYALFFQGKSEREAAQEFGVYQFAVHKRKQCILQKLKKLLDK